MPVCALCWSLCFMMTNTSRFSDVQTKQNTVSSLALGFGYGTGGRSFISAAVPLSVSRLLADEPISPQCWIKPSLLLGRRPASFTGNPLGALPSTSSGVIPPASKDLLLSWSYPSGILLGLVPPSPTHSPDRFPFSFPRLQSLSCTDCSSPCWPWINHTPKVNHDPLSKSSSVSLRPFSAEPLGGSRLWYLHLLCPHPIRPSPQSSRPSPRQSNCHVKDPVQSVFLCPTVPCATYMLSKTLVGLNVQTTGGCIIMKRLREQVLGAQPWLCHFRAVWPQASYLSPPYCSVMGGW